jgi:hypothetical protein
MRMTSPQGVSRKLVIGGAAVVIAVAGLAYWLRTEAIERIYASVKPAPPAPIQPGRSKSRDRSARPLWGHHVSLDWRFRVYRQMRVEDWHATDCYMLAESLLRKDRPALSRAALEAARRIDSHHRETIEGLVWLKGLEAAAPPRQRAELHDALKRIEPLQSVPIGPSLGLLVLAVDHYAKDRVQEEEFLDRLRARYNASLKRLHTPADVVKMVARLLLETGRAAEARELLEPLLEPGGRGGPSPDQAPADREAAWLLSRAALQIGAHETADEMLALAAEFGKNPDAVVEPSPFIGSRRCAECHRTIYRAQQRGSRHAQTLRFGSDLKDVPLPTKPIADEAVAGITHSFERTSDREIVMLSRKDSQVFRAIVDYAVGSGRHGITMLGRDEEGIERELRVSYFEPDGIWGQTKGITFAPQRPGDHNGVALGQKEVNQCLSCHATWFRSVDPDHAGARPPEGKDRGIGCERCHGPGSNHVLAAESGFAELAIMLTPRTPSRAQLSSCAECHSEDGTVPPSDPEFTRFQGTTFLLSRCFIANQDRFACTTCHDPHAALVTESSHYEAKCLRCHAHEPRGERAVEAAARKSSALSSGGGKACPVNPSTKCISCHMPKVEDPSRHARFTDHHIRAQRRDSQVENRESSQRRVPSHGVRLK